MRITSYIKYSLFFLCAAALLYSCSSNNSVVSSFGKRKYTKGYFVNIPGNEEKVASKVQTPEVLNTEVGKVSKPDAVKENVGVGMVKMPSVETPASNSFRPVASINKNSFAPMLTAKQMLPDTVQEIQDTSDDYKQDQKTNRILGVIGFTAAIVGAVFLVVPNFIIAGICLLAGLIISGLGIKRGSNSLLAFIGFIISAVGVLILLDFLIVSHQ